MFPGMQVMHDIRSIRDNPKDFDKKLGRRGVIAASEEILKIDEDRRSAILSAETAQAEQNKSKYHERQRNNETLRQET